jgi:hypothetical protein
MLTNLAFQKTRMNVPPLALMTPGITGAHISKGIA